MEDHFDKLRHATKHDRTRTWGHTVDYSLYNIVISYFNTVMISITGGDVCSRLCNLLCVNNIAKERDGKNKIKFYKK